MGYVRPAVATAGTFDGVHRGHMAVLADLINTASSEGMRALAITFDRHPLETVAPHRAPLMLSSPLRQEELIRKAGAEMMRLPFDKATASLSAREWIRLLRDKHDVRILVIGYDNTFGHDGLEMSIADYIRLAKEEGVTVIEAPVVEGVSSSRIRRAVSEGKVEEAAGLLGRPYELEGVVVKGNALGRSLGHPTANLVSHPRRLTPGDGVYAAAAITPDGSLHPAMVNIGVRPTVDNTGVRTTEANIIGWDGDLYTRQLTLFFLSRLRDEKHFDSLDSLKRQLELDAQEANKIFNNYPDIIS